jgi:hypothetical protein
LRKIQSLVVEIFSVLIPKYKLGCGLVQQAMLQRAAGYATCAAGYTKGAAGYATGAAGNATGAAGYATGAAGYALFSQIIMPLCGPSCKLRLF